MQQYLELLRHIRERGAMVGPDHYAVAAYLSVCRSCDTIKGFLGMRPIMNGRFEQTQLFVDMGG